MNSLRRALALVAVEGLIVGLVALAIVLSSEHIELRGLQGAIGLFIGWSFIGTGLFAWWRRPDSRVGVLMCATGFAWFLGALTAADADALFTIGILFASVHLAVFAHMLLAYPSGRISDPRVRRVVLAGYAITIVGPLPVLLFGTADDFGDCDCPDTVLRITDNETLLDVFDALTSVVAVVIVGIVLYILLKRWQTASAPRRRSLAPVMASGIALLLLSAAQLTSNVVGGPGFVLDGLSLLSLVAFALTPYGFLLGLVKSRVVRAGAVSDLLQSIGDGRAGSLRQLLSDALGDPSLEVIYWLEEPGDWVGADGHPAAAPDPVQMGETWTEVENDGRRVGAILHDRALSQDPDLLRTVSVAAGLAIQNERLHAQLRARVEDLRASRARLVEAGTAERRRLERNLHDGAQQRLVALSLTLRLAQNRVEKDPKGSIDLLAAAQEELTLALEELRELARGIHPAVLSDRGLSAALEALAGRSPVPVELAPVPEERLPAPVEAAAYFVVAEALTNVVKYAGATQARVCVSRVNGHAVVEVADDGVGGADPTRGTGLRGLVDRVAALDGRLQIESPPGAGTTLRAEIPV